jgi:hypothetical protein
LKETFSLSPWSHKLKVGLFYFSCVTSLSGIIFCKRRKAFSSGYEDVRLFHFCEKYAALYAEAYVTILSIHVVDQTWTTTSSAVHKVVARYDFRIRQKPIAALLGLERNGRSQICASARDDGSSKNPIEATRSRTVKR